MSCISSSPHPWGLVGRACSGPEAPPKPEAQWGCGGAATVSNNPTEFQLLVLFNILF